MAHMSRRAKMHFLHFRTPRVLFVFRFRNQNKKIWRVRVARSLHSIWALKKNIFTWLCLCAEEALFVIVPLLPLRKNKYSFLYLTTLNKLARDLLHLSRFLFLFCIWLQLHHLRAQVEANRGWPTDFIADKIVTVEERWPFQKHEIIYGTMNVLLGQIFLSFCSEVLRLLENRICSMMLVVKIDLLLSELFLTQPTWIT